MLRRLVMSAAVGLVISGAAFAGGVAEPVMEPDVVAKQSSSSAGGIIVPLLLLLLVVALVSNGDDSVAP